MVYHVARRQDAVRFRQVLKWVEALHLVEIRHQFEQITFIRQVVVVLYFGVDLVVFERLRNFILPPLRPEEADLVKMSRAVFELFNSYKPRSAL